MAYLLYDSGKRAQSARPIATNACNDIDLTFGNSDALELLLASLPCTFLCGNVLGHSAGIDLKCIMIIVAFMVSMFPAVILAV